MSEQQIAGTSYVLLHFIQNDLLAQRDRINTRFVNRKLQTRASRSESDNRLWKIRLANCWAVAENPKCIQVSVYQHRRITTRGSTLCTHLRWTIVDGIQSDLLLKRVQILVSHGSMERNVLQHNDRTNKFVLEILEIQRVQPDVERLYAIPCWFHYDVQVLGPC